MGGGGKGQGGLVGVWLGELTIVGLVAADRDHTVIAETCLGLVSRMA